MANFKGATSKLSIGSLEDNSLNVTAQYNPKELPVSNTVDWQEHAGMVVEYGDQKGRELTVELMFDGYEAKASVMAQLIKLEQLSSPIDPDAKSVSLRRPHRCVMVWGDKIKLTCVITSLDTKFVMWNDDGLPVRAIATVKLKEIDVQAMALAERRAGYAAQPGMLRVS